MEGVEITDVEDDIREARGGDTGLRAGNEQVDQDEELLIGERLEILRKEIEEQTRLEGDPVGSLRKKIYVWEKYGCAPEVMRWLREGVRLIMNGQPKHFGGRGNYVQKEALNFVNKEITRLILTGAVEVVEDLEYMAEWNHGYEAPLGAAYKASDTTEKKWRLVMNLTDAGMGPNNFMPDRKFKMETIENLLKMMGKNWVGFTFDLRAGFHHLLIHPDDRKWLRFRWAGKLYQFRAMPFGARHSPFFFHKTVKELMGILRRGCVVEGCTHTDCAFRAAPMGISVVSYVDDFAVVAESLALALRIRDEIVTPILKEMGWIRAVDKGSWEPSTRFKFLGLEIDSSTGMVLIPEDKLKKYTAALERLLSARTVTPREVAQVSGKVVSVMRAFAPALVYLRTTFAWIAGLVEGTEGWSSDRVLDPLQRRDLKWLKDHLRERNGRFAWRPPGVIVLAGDASSSVGWGATLRVGNKVRLARGAWSRVDKEEDIHILELRSLLYGIGSFGNEIAGRNIQLWTDNKISYHTVPKGSAIERIQRLVREIHDELGRRDANLVDVLWIPSEANVIPDFLSRFVDVNDWGVTDHTWDVIRNEWPDLQVDRFADQYNARLRRWNSRWAHPQSDAANALAQDWTGTFSYVCPPMAMVQEVLTFIDRQGYRAVVVVPVWGKQVWWPLLRAVSVRKVVLGPGIEVFQKGMSGECAPHKDARWTFWAVEVQGRGR